MASERANEEPRAAPPVDEGVGPARPIERGHAEEQPAGSAPGGEHVGRAQPMDPARRRSPREPSQAPSVTDDEPRATPTPAPPAREAAPPRAAMRRSRSVGALGAVERVRRANFPVALRGYDRAAVDAYVAEVAQLVAELEARQLPETVVQRALDEVGEETSAILKRAHEAAEDIAARSRAQADDRLERAEREAELVRQEGEEQVRRLEEELQSIWSERQRLIEDVRHLADDVLSLADDAIDRIPLPGAGDAPDEPPAEPADGSASAGPTGGDEPPEPELLDERRSATASESITIVDEPSQQVAEPRPEDDDTAERPAGGPPPGP